MNLETSLGAIARLRAFEETTPAGDDTKATGAPDASWPENGELKLSNIRASYSRCVDELDSCPEQYLVGCVGPGEDFGMGDTCGDDFKGLVS